MKTLILGQIPDNFSPEKHAVIGPFCFVGKEEVYEGWEELPMEPDPFSDWEEIKKMDLITSKYSHQIAKRIGIKLNEKLDLTYSSAFWQTILYPWIGILVQVLYERQTRLLNLIKTQANDSVMVRGSALDTNWKFSDSLDFVNNGVFNIHFNEWIFTKLLKNCLPAKWVIEYDTDVRVKSIGTKNNVESQIGAITKFKRKVKSVFLKPFHRINGMNGFSFFDQVLFSALLYIKRTSTITPNITTLIDNDDEVEITWLVDVESLIWRLMPESILNLPTHIANNNYSFKKGKINLGSQSLWTDDLGYKLKCALAIENGETIVGYQHGGAYGISKIFNLGYHIEYRYKAFITWGWSKQEEIEANCVPLPSPYLSKVRNRHKKRNELVILVGTRAQILPYHNDGVPQASQWVGYRSEKLRLIESLDNAIKADFRYRPYFNDTGALKDLDYFNERVPSLKVLTGDLGNALFDCKLLILDHPYTTLILAMASNIPTICFWDIKSFPLSQQAEPLFEDLRRAGIIFENGEEAARKINDIYDNVEEWWAQDDIQEARRSWVEQYAYSKTNWRWDWIKFLWNL